VVDTAKDFAHTKVQIYEAVPAMLPEEPIPFFRHITRPSPRETFRNIRSIVVDV
jgi:hypothetical protein